MSSTLIHVIFEADTQRGPAQQIVRLLVNSGEVKLPAKRLGGSEELYVVSARLPTIAEVAIIQLGRREPKDNPDGDQGEEQVIHYDERSYAFSLIYNAVVFLKWNSHFIKYNVANRHHSFILCSHPQILSSVRVVGSTAALGKWEPTKIEAKTVRLRKCLSFAAVPAAGEEVEFNLLSRSVDDIKWESMEKKKTVFSPAKSDVFVLSTWGKDKIYTTFTNPHPVCEDIAQRPHIVFRILQCTTVPVFATNVPHAQDQTVGTSTQRQRVGVGVGVDTEDSTETERPINPDCFTLTQKPVGSVTGLPPPAPKHPHPPELLENPSGGFDPSIDHPLNKGEGELDYTVKEDLKDHDDDEGEIATRRKTSKGEPRGFHCSPTRFGVSPVRESSMSRRAKIAETHPIKNHVQFGNITEAELREVSSLDESKKHGRYCRIKRSLSGMKPK